MAVFIAAPRRSLWLPKRDFYSKELNELRTIFPQNAKLTAAAMATEQLLSLCRHPTPHHYSALCVRAYVLRWAGWLVRLMRNCCENFANSFRSAEQAIRAEPKLFRPKFKYFEIKSSQNENRKPVNRSSEHYGEARKRMVKTKSGRLKEFIGSAMFSMTIRRAATI